MIQPFLPPSPGRRANLLLAGLMLCTVAASAHEPWNRFRGPNGPVAAGA